MTESEITLFSAQISGIERWDEEDKGMQYQGIDKRTWLMNLAFSCPMQESLPSCIIEQFRNLPSSEWISQIKALSEYEVDTMLKHHHACLEQREQAINPHLIMRASCG